MNMQLKSYLDKRLKVKHQVVVEKNETGRYTVTEYTFNGWGDTLKHIIHGNDYSRADAYAKRREILACYK